MIENDISKLIQLEASRVGATTFRNNTGMGWIGTRLVDPRPNVVVLANARPLHAGLIKGSSDLIGWKRITITADMVGRTLAVFTAIEVKAGRRTATPEQLTFIENVRNAGGIAGIARTPEEARNLLENYL